LLVLCACGGAAGSPDAGAPAWDRSLPEATVMGGVRGLQPARGIIHLHSPYSHDACDGNPRPPNDGGPVDETCLAHQRAALCAAHVDIAALTDHPDTMADTDFPALFLMRAGDQAVNAPDGHQLASRIRCDDGHAVLVTVGAENALMPIMLDHHVAGGHAVYTTDDATAVAAMHDAGAVVWIAHSEQRTQAQLDALQPDGIELYNLHANIDPKIRPMYLGLDASGAIAAVAEFADTGDLALEPDLALISFLSANGPALDRWNEQLAAGRHLPASAGTDAHENSLPIVMRDGERGDSYRRMIRWFANIALVADRGDPAQVEDAIRGGRFFVAFELFGTPVGFDAFVIDAQGGAAAIAGMGDTITASATATFTVKVPAIDALDPALPAPEIHARLLRIDPGGVHELAAGPGPTLTAPATLPGAYRVEITIRPHHLGAYLGHLGTALADQELPWIYGNPIYVTAPPT
jgi:hypothetical protein